MSTIYTPNPANNPASITIPSDGDVVDAASVNPAFEGLMDRDSRKLDTVSGGTVDGPVTFTAKVVFDTPAVPDEVDFLGPVHVNNDMTVLTTLKLASRTVTRVQRNTWSNFESIWSHVDCIGDGLGPFNLNNIGSLVFDDTTGAGSGTVAILELDLPNGSSLTSITATFKGAAGHTALPSVHPFQFRLIVVEISTGIATPSSLKSDPSVNVANYEVIHNFSQGYGPPLVVDNTAFRYLFQAVAEIGTGTTAVNGGRVVAVQTACTVTEQDPGGS